MRRSRILGEDQWKKTPYMLHLTVPFARSQPSSVKIRFLWGHCFSWRVNDRHFYRIPGTQNLICSLQAWWFVLNILFNTQNGSCPSPSPSVLMCCFLWGSWQESPHGQRCLACVSSICVPCRPSPCCCRTPSRTMPGTGKFFFCTCIFCPDAAKGIMKPKTRSCVLRICYPIKNLNLVAKIWQGYIPTGGLVSPTSVFWYYLNPLKPLQHGD